MQENTHTHTQKRKDYIFPQLYLSITDFFTLIYNFFNIEILLTK